MVPSTVTVIHLDPEVLSLLEGAVIPLAVSVITKSRASGTVKALTNAALSAVAGAVTTALAAHGVIDWQTYALDIGSAFLASVTAYHGLWAPTNTTGSIKLLTGDFGIGAPATPAINARSRRSHFVGAHLKKPEDPEGDRAVQAFDDWMHQLKEPLTEAEIDAEEAIIFHGAITDATNTSPIAPDDTDPAAGPPSAPPQENPVPPEPPHAFQPSNLLGRIYVPDERDQGYLMSRRITAPAPVGAKLWPTSTLYDQGQTPACTGYSSSGALSSLFWAEKQFALVFNAGALYAWANGHDGIVGPHQGSTVRAAFQGLISQGDQVLTSTTSAIAKAAFEKIQNYLWADVTQPDADIETIITWILTVSPVVIGINWYNDMFTPGPTGYVSPTGGIAGGHAIMIRGVNATVPGQAVFVLRNSWGPWGVTVNGGSTGNWAVTPQPSGDALITQANLVALLADQGECGALVDALAPFPAPTPTPPTPTPAPPAPLPTPVPTPVPVASVVVTPTLIAEVTAIMAASEARILAILGGSQ